MVPGDQSAGKKRVRPTRHLLHHRAVSSSPWSTSMSNIKDAAVKAGHTIADKAGDAAQAVATGVNHAVQYVKEKVGLEGPDKGVGAIEERMDVIASCGSKV